MNISDVIQITSEVTKLPVDRIKSKSRRQDLAKARFIISRVGGRVLGFSATSIGRSLGGRDHTTILHAQRRWKKFYESDDRFALDHCEVLDRLRKRHMAKKLGTSKPVNESQPI